MAKTEGLVLEERMLIGTVAPAAAFEDMSRFRNNEVHTDVTWVRLPSGLWVRYCNGTSSRVVVTDNFSLDFTNNTMTIWANLVSTMPTAVSARILCLKSAAGLLGLGYYQTVAVGTRTLVFMADTGANRATYTWAADDRWHQWTGVYNGTPYLYMDGVLVATGIADTWTPNATDLYLGGSPAGRYCQCYISGVRIYNRALSDTEVRKRFEATRSWYGV